jgi:hypothetical protein
MGPNSSRSKAHWSDAYRKDEYENLHTQAADCYRMLVQLRVRTLYAFVAFVTT